MNTVVNVAVLLFLGYALLGPGPLGMKIREYTAAREARMAVRDVFARLVTEGRVDSARPTIIEFTDFQCPLLPRHDWIDDADWVRLARDAGVLDLMQFEECLDASGTEQELARHVAVARQILVPLAIGFTNLTAACGGDDPSPRVNAEVDTIGGVVVVRNGTGLWRESEEWRVAEVFRTGSLLGGSTDEELSYSRNDTVTLGPNGQIFVLEYATARVVVFSGGGEFVRSFGRAGEGPGEFAAPTGMTWDGSDRLWVADGLRGRYHAFDSTGVVQKTVRRPTSVLKRLQHPLAWKSGTLVDESGDAAAGVVLYFRVDTLGNLTDTLAVISIPEPTRAFRGPLLRSWEAARFVLAHYEPEYRWSLASDGTIWLSETGQLRLIQTSPDGDTMRIVETSHRATEFDQRDLKMIAEGLAEAGIPRRDVELFPTATSPPSSAIRSSRSLPGPSMCPTSCAPR